MQKVKVNEEAISQRVKFEIDKINHTKNKSFSIKF